MKVEEIHTWPGLFINSMGIIEDSFSMSLFSETLVASMVITLSTLFPNAKENVPEQ